MSEPNTSPAGVQRALVAALDKAIGIHRPAVAAHVRRIRERHPEASPSDAIARLEKLYLAAVIGMGAADGAVAAAPGVGTAAAVALSVRNRGVPCSIASSALRTTMSCAQLPPIQPVSVPSGAMIALSPGFDDVGRSARTTVAIAKG